MQRARRLAPIAVVVAVGIIALTGCRAQPDVAAYLGDRQITEDRITGIIDEVKKNPAQQSGQAPAEGGAARVPTRGEVVSLLVFNDACERFTTDKALKPQRPVTAEEVGQGLGFAPNTEYARELADSYTCRSALPAGEPVKPTEEQLVKLIADARAAGLGENGETDVQLRQALDGEQFQGALGQRKLLEDEFARFDITVNPRYRPLEFPILAFPNEDQAVGVTLGEPGTGAVTNRS
ncbi:hypothetical protein BDK92_4592 [Micromonospora pisi]|uniref:Peptidyl-prolyl cis-trans isomerase SurA n=1 Tax=Micromonospora pisi TaxID=589240 RepID=A0A495JPB4_9ACTN|nr:hypothetical protein [Micromonospora pisi]RKR90224.1 hypothetical protein BDK92_4592 [Micromonospora pisi]